MKLTDPQKRTLISMYEFNCFVHLFTPVRSDNVTSFFGNPRPGGKSGNPFNITVRPATVRKLHELGLLMQVDDNRFLLASKYDLSKKGKKVAAKLAQERRQESEG